MPQTNPIWQIKLISLNFGNATKCILGHFQILGPQKRKDSKIGLSYVMWKWNKFNLPYWVSLWHFWLWLCRGGALLLRKGRSLNPVQLCRVSLWSSSPLTTLSIMSSTSLLLLATSVRILEAASTSRSSISTSGATFAAITSNWRGAFLPLLALSRRWF